jgi:dTMP kinase
VDIEGLDGAGASTQVKLVGESLRKLGISPLLTKEPTSGVIGRLIRQALQKKINLVPESLQLLFVADRAQHLEKEIIPALQKGKVVITDRYLWSTVAFGSIGSEKEWLLDLNRNFILPDLSFFVEVEPEVCLQRIGRDKARSGLELFEKRERLEQAWDVYQWLSEKYWWAQIMMIDGEKPKEEVAAAILARLKIHPKFKKIV